MYQLLFVITGLILLEKGYALAGEHMCYDEETYTELEQEKTTQPVKVRSYNWCLSFPPRCSNYRTEIKEVIKLQNITKTRLIEHCCKGFTELQDPAKNETICIPICRGGCRHGYCELPNQCACDVGYDGQHCAQRCRPKMFGRNCKNLCKCRNGSLCDHKTGFCRCTEGWIGDLCEIPCPSGKFGIMCQSTCQCGSNKCNPESGDCIVENHQILFDLSGPNRSNIMKLSDERIKVKHWIKVNGNGKLIMNNCSAVEKCDNETSTIDPLHGVILATSVNHTAEKKIVHLIGKTHEHHVQVQKNNTIIMNALNSSIANLTNDVGKLTKQVSDQQDEIKKVTNSTATAYLPKVAILLDSHPILTSTNIESRQSTENPIQENDLHEMETNMVSLSNNNNNIIQQQEDPQVSVMNSLNRHVERIPAEQLSIIETRATIQETLLQDSSSSNDNSNVDENSATAGGGGGGGGSSGTQTNNNNPNEIFHVFSTIEDRIENDNATIVDRQLHELKENSKIISHIILGLIVLIVVSLIAFGLIYSARKKQRTQINHTLRSQDSSIDLSEQQIGQKPLPEIPSFTHSITRRIIAQQDFYDRPSNNLSVRENLNKLGNDRRTNRSPIVCHEPIYARSRKQSAEHIYDEINYVGGTATMETNKR